MEIRTELNQTTFFESLIDKIIVENTVDVTGFRPTDLANSIVLNQDIMPLEGSVKNAFLLFCIEKLNNILHVSPIYYQDDTLFKNATVTRDCIQFLKSKVKLQDSDLVLIIRSFNFHKRWETYNLYQLPVSIFIGIIEKQYKNQQISLELASELEIFNENLFNEKESFDNKDRIKTIDKINKIIYSSKNASLSTRPVLFLGNDPFSDYANKMIENMPENERKCWYAIISKGQTASGGKPAQKYLDEAQALLEKLGAGQFKKTFMDWVGFLTRLKDTDSMHSTTYDNGHVYDFRTIEYLSALNLEALKGIVWMASQLQDPEITRILPKLVERCFEKIPGKGPAAAALGNACLFVLYKTKGFEGVSQLSRLKLRIKQSATQAIIEKYLSDAAAEQGVSIHEMEDMVVPDFELVEGKKELWFDDIKCTLSITGTGKSEIKWEKSDGTILKSEPKSVKENHADNLKHLKETQKQIDQTTSAQRDRIDRMFRADRKWSFEAFREHFLEHGLMSFLTNKIIWTFTKDGASISAIHIANRWTNADNEEVFPDPAAVVSLWHPATHTLAEIKKWRDLLMELQLQQPLKQAFREVYLLTEAELNTRTYSNRMAAHVLKQHQFNMLAKTRGWKYALLGAYDDGRSNATATISLPEYKMRAEYWVNELNADNAWNETGIWNYITTDQVRFLDSHDVLLDLITVPPIPFSEIMRDVDLFVGVASVGNDPSWGDTGGLPVYRDYWSSYSFGELSEVAKNRKEILQSLIPRLKINKIAEIKDKFLYVKGKIRTYKIHIGSTNILMEPNDQYLCIVPDRSLKSGATDNLFLPFDGDTGLSIILSKAFLLADDDKITDPSIVSQIAGK